MNDDAQSGAPRDDVDTIVVAAEPGLPADTVRNDDERLSEIIEAAGLRYGGLQVSQTSLQVSAPQAYETPPTDAVPGEHAATVYVTEMPRMRHGRGIVAEVDRRHRIAIISTPALRPGIRRQLRQTIESAVTRMTEAHESADADERWLAADGVDFLLLGKRVSTAAMVAGMVRGNRPWRLVPTLTGFTAAAAAAASFGVFFSSIWMMAASLSIVRLSVVAAGALVIVVGWLVINNNLWDRGDALPKWQIRFNNVSTMVTVVVSALAVYAGLYCATLVGAFGVIDPHFLSAQLGRPAGWSGYFTLAWLATSMGMLAGGLGSSVDSVEDVLSATYGHRERLRRRELARDDPRRL